MTENRDAFNRVLALLEEGREAEFFLDGENYVIMCSGHFITVWQCADTPEAVAVAEYDGNTESSLRTLFSDPLFTISARGSAGLISYHRGLSSGYLLSGSH